MSVDPGRWVADRWVPTSAPSLDEQHTRWCQVCQAWHLREGFLKDTGACIIRRNATRRRRYQLQKRSQ